jgi:hypothetical protein
MLVVITTNISVNSMATGLQLQDSAGNYTGGEKSIIRLRFGGGGIHATFFRGLSVDFRLHNYMPQ